MSKATAPAGGKGAPPTPRGPKGSASGLPGEADGTVDSGSPGGDPKGR
ncbi:MAG: hypothetical protein Kow0013_07160 [Pararhodobacter sp.]